MPDVIEPDAVDDADMVDDIDAGGTDDGVPIDVVGEVDGGETDEGVPTDSADTVDDADMVDDIDAGGTDDGVPIDVVGEVDAGETDEGVPTDAADTVDYADATGDEGMPGDQGAADPGVRDRGADPDPDPDSTNPLDIIQTDNNPHNPDAFAEGDENERGNGCSTNGKGSPEGMIPVAVLGIAVLMRNRLEEWWKSITKPTANSRD